MERKYYQQELTKIRSLAADFAHDYPAIAPMLAKDVTDPDVERLLEGFAYLTAGVQEQLDRQFPFLAQSLCEIFFPNFLLPTPSMVMMQFEPPVSGGRAIKLPKGTEVGSKPVDGVSCKFTSTRDHQVEPLVVTKLTNTTAANGLPIIELDLMTVGLTLSKWNADYIDFYIQGDFAEAADLYLCLRHNCQKIGIKTGENDETTLQSTCLQPLLNNHLTLQVNNAANCFELWRESLTFRQSFLQLRLNNLDKWSERGHGVNFKIIFYLDNLPTWYQTDNNATLQTNVIPFINIFNQDAAPIRYDNTQTEYPITIDANNAATMAIYNVESVELSNSKQKKLVQYNNVRDQISQANKGDDVYTLHYYKDDLKNKVDFSIALYNDHNLLETNTDDIITIGLKVCNAELASRLLPGEINQPTIKSPENVKYSNLHVPTQYFPLSLNTQLLWQLLSLISFNYINENSIEQIKQILELLIQTLPGFNPQATHKRLNSISNYNMKQGSLLYQDATLTGYDVEFTCKVSNFLSHGDLYIFGEALDYFLAAKLPINTFVRLNIKIAESGEELIWPARTVDQILE